MIVEPIRPPSAGKEELAMSAQNKSSGIDEWMLQKVYRGAGQPAVRLALRNGVEVSPKGALPAANIVIQDRKTLFRLLLDPEAEFGDAYSEGRITLEGDLVSALEIVYRSMAEVAHHSWYVKLVSKCMEYVQRNSLRGSRRNIRQHYDLNTDFYQLWLDPQLVYTCAYYASPGATLEQAQVAKLDYVCRKVQLQPGERVVEAGCGWGALALHMAKNYGVTVRALIFHASKSWSPVGGQTSWDSATGWSSSKMITGTSPASVMPLSLWECWNTLDGNTTATWGVSFTARSPKTAAGSSTL